MSNVKYCRFASYALLSFFFFYSVGCVALDYADNDFSEVRFAYYQMGKEFPSSSKKILFFCFKEKKLSLGEPIMIYYSNNNQKSTAITYGLVKGTWTLQVLSVSDGFFTNGNIVLAFDSVNAQVNNYSRSYIDLLKLMAIKDRVKYEVFNLKGTMLEKTFDCNIAKRLRKSSITEASYGKM